MTVTSPAFRHGATIPVKYTCDGDDVSPPLSFASVPRKAVEIILIMEDPDAPGGTYTHWLLFRIPPKTKKIAEDTIPAGSHQGTNSFGSQEYGGPCPPPLQTHRYYFRAFALGKRSGLQHGADAGTVATAAKTKSIASAELMGTYACELIACILR